MPRRIVLLPFVLLVLLTAGTRGVVAQPPTPAQLSPVAQSLRAYLPAQADLPVGVRLTGSVIEFNNEDTAAADPDQAALIQKYSRITGIVQVAERTNPPADMSVAIILFKDAEGAWGDAVDSTFAPGAEVERTLPGPDVGERSVLFRQLSGVGPDRQEGYMLVFQRDRLEVAVSIDGEPGEVSADTLLPIARAIDAKILARPPGPVTADELAMLEAPTPAVLVRGAVRLLLRDYVEPLEAGQLLTEAWQGAAEALTAAGVRNVPPPPDYPSDEDVAIALHMERFPLLERLAEGRMELRQLAYAAISALVDRRDDCHTVFITAEEWRAQKDLEAGMGPILIGVGFTREPPMRILYVFPGSPAKAAGMRRGQTVLAINGTSIVGLSIEAARALIDRREGAPNTFVVQNPSGRIQEITVAPVRYRVPAMESEVLPGNIGLIRFYDFRPEESQVRMLRQTLESFEAQGVQGWVIDLRDNAGGFQSTMTAMTSLFIDDGRLFGAVTRGGSPRYVNANGNALPFQRPLVFLVGPGSASAAEIMPGALQARGRAVVVGERTAGCFGSSRAGNGLLDGSVLNVTRTEIVIGPDDRRYNKVGLTPDVEAPAPTPEDEEAGYDPQLAAAIGVLQQRIGQPVTSSP